MPAVLPDWLISGTMMIRRYLWTLLSTLCVLVVYSGYAQITGRLLSRERVSRPIARSQEIDRLPSIGPRGSQEVAERYLPDAPWARDARVKIRADGLHVFFNQREHENSKTELRVSPVAIVWTPGAATDEGAASDSKREPLIILADSAIFQFDQPVELSDVQTRLIRQIVLGGKVQIRGENDLHLFGSNFTFSRASRTLFSDEPFEFRMQQHRGYARYISLNLDMLDGGQHENNPRIVGIRELNIREHLELLLQPENEPPLLVTCEENFLYRFEQQQAVLVGDVLLRRTDPEGFLDQLLCDRLTLQLEKTSGAPAATAEIVKKLPAGAERMTLRWIEAQGNPVQCESQAQQLTAAGQHLRYDLQQRVLIVRDKKEVKVLFQGVNLLTPQLELHLDERQQPVFAHCAGPGQLQFRQQTSPDGKPVAQKPLAEAQWRDSLTMESDPADPEHKKLVTLTGTARLSSPEHRAGLIARTLQLWIHQEPDSAATRPASLQGGKPVLPPGLRMERARATGDVAIAHAQLEGKYESLELTFEENEPAILAALPREQPGEPGGIQLVQAEQSAGGSDQPAEKPRLAIDARELKLKLIHDATFRRLHLAHVRSDGEMRGTGFLPNQQESITVSGREAEIFNDGGERQRFHLLGTAERYAWAQNGAIRIDGIDLFVDRVANLARVHGSGSLQLPVKSDWEGMPLGQADLLQVSWKEQMRFDGRQAIFEGRVRANIGDSVISCEQLAVKFDQLISLQRPDQQIEPKITEIECRDRVRFEMNHYEEGKLNGVRYVNVSLFQINHVSGAMKAQGPGSMEFWQRQTGKSPLGLPEATMSQGPNGKSTPKAATGWDYTRVTFAGNLTGNVHEQYAILKDRVNILHGPVDRPLVSFERDARPPRSVWVRCDELQLLLRKVAGDAKPTANSPGAMPLEIKAEQNAEIEGDQFLARADVISYDHSSQLFVMRATENRHTTLWYFETPQSPRARYDVKMVRMSPNGNLLELDRTLGASGSR